MPWQNSQIVLNNLSKHSTSDIKYKFHNLYRNFYNRDFYIKAYAKIYKDKCSETANGFSEELIISLIEEVKNIRGLYNYY